MKHIFKSNLLNGILSGQFILVFNIIVGIWLTPYLISHIGKSGYGIWILLNSVVGYYGLLNLGIDLAVKKYLAQYLGEKAVEDYHSVIWTSLVFFISLASVIVLFALVLSPQIVNYINFEGEQDKAIKIFNYLSISIALNFVSSVFVSILHANEKFVHLNLSNLLSTIIRTILIIIFLHQGFGIVSIATATLIASVFTLFFNIILSVFYGKMRFYKQRDLKKDIFKKIFTFGYFTLIIKICDIVRYNLDSVIISKFLNLALTGSYGIGIKITHYSMMLISTAVQILGPRFSGLLGENQNENIKRLFLNSLYISSLLSCFLTLFAIIIGPQVIYHWVGVEFQDSIHVLWVFAIGFCLELCQHPCVILAYGKNKHKFYAYTGMIEVVINLILSIVLIKTYGLVGVALGTVIPLVIIRGIMLPPYIMKIMELSVREYTSPFIVPIISSLLTFFLCYFSRLIVYESKEVFIIVTIKAIVVGFIYLVLNSIFDRLIQTEYGVLKFINKVTRK